LFCRNGLQYYTRIPEKPIRAALGEVVTQTDSLRTARPSTPSGNLLQLELELAARMAAQSCKFMLWQQALAAGLRPARPRNCASAAKAMARSGIRELKELNQEFERYWPRRNKGSTAFCSAFLHWRIQDYQHGRLHLPRNKEPIA